ncbi:MAG TPA: type 4a pilus biogenesis protein PilO [Gemmatimonadaceae bacterium]|jgi:type IV pilus assembly protein PilO|nr:type 4a pilus biogenesis protein PilO [Gemmatimonadaceae bacterium]
MALLPSNSRDQKMLLYAIVPLALAAAYWYLLWSPQNVMLGETQSHVDSLLVINQRAKSELAQGKTAQLKAEAEQYAQDLEVMRQLVPTGNEVPALLEQVSTAARRVGLDIADVQPLPQLTGDQYDAYKYRMSVKGSYNQIALFLSNVGSLQRIVAPVNLSLNPNPNDARARKEARTQSLDARFEIQTYVARTRPTPKPAPAGRPAPEPSKPGER